MLRKTRHFAWMLLHRARRGRCRRRRRRRTARSTSTKRASKSSRCLPRVGPAVAQRIVDFREQNGSFKAVEDLMLVRGIGEKTFERLAPYITLSGETTLSEKVRSGAGGGEEDERR